jgi:hypothetical protein
MQLSLEEHAESSKERRRKDRVLRNNTDGGGMEEVCGMKGLLWEEEGRKGTELSERRKKSGKKKLVDVIK